MILYTASVTDLPLNTQIIANNRSMQERSYSQIDKQKQVQLTWGYWQAQNDIFLLLDRI